MNVDRICQYIESKLPRSTWEFHGPDIRRFIEAEAKSQSGVIRDLAEACQDLVSMTYDDRPGPGTSRDKLRSARARAAKLLEMTQYPCEAKPPVSTNVISDVREFGRTLTPAEVAAVCRGEEVPCEASS